MRVAVSGYMDPIHAGHIECMELAKELGSKLIVLLNTDEQAVAKKGYVFMPYSERELIIKALRCVDEVVKVIDTDGSVCKTVELVKPDIYAKGGDRFSNEIPEAEVCRRLGIKLVDGLGAKIQSSSDLVKRKTELNQGQ